MSAWFTNTGCFLGDDFETTISTNPQLLQRAHNEITSAFNVNDPDDVTPTHLIISQFNDARVKNGGTAEVRISCNSLCHYISSLII